MIRPVRSDGTIETGGVFVPIVRRRVIDRIASAAMQRVVLIVAPAGYGKSVALAQFLAASKEPCVRFDVRSDHGALLGFLRGFSDALVEIAPDARTTLPGAYEKNSGSPSPGADLALWMHSHVKSYRGVIAIDDLHVAQEDREVTRFLSALIERTKGRVQWIIASRSTLGLPIGTWLAYGDSDLAIDEHDLKFSVEEAKEAARTFRLGVRDEELYDLLHLTDGWATAISFALRSSTRSIDLRNISTMTREMIYRYLAEQVYATLNEEERRFIESASLLSEINVDVMNEAGFDRAAAMIEDLRQRVAFIHEHAAGYRLHDLFREFIQHQLALQGKRVALERRVTLGAVLQKRGEFDAALNLFVDAGSPEHMVQLLLAHGMYLITQGHGDVVTRALEAIPPPMHAREAILNGLRGILEIVAGRYDSGERHLQRAIRLGGDPRVRAELILRLAMFLVNQGRDPNDLLLSLLESDAPEETKLEARAMLAVFAVRTGDAHRAAANITIVEGSLGDVIEVTLLAKLLQRIGLARQESGDIDRARSYQEKAAELASSSGQWSLASRAYQALSACAALGEGDTSLASWYSQQAAAAATKAGDYFDLQISLLQMLAQEVKRGNAERTLQIERQLAELRPNDTMRAPYVMASQAHRHAWNGELEEAARLFGIVQERSAHAADRALTAAFRAICLALDSKTKESAEATEGALEKLPAGATEYGSSIYEAALLLSALAEALSGRHTAAQRILKRPPIASTEAMSCMREAVEQLARAAKSASYVPDDMAARIAALETLGFGNYGRYLRAGAAYIESSHTQEVVVKLTPSELRIIRSLASGLTTKDIAAEMERSVYTVQTHIQNLIEKLGCHGRAEAIATARRMGYLEDAL